QDVVVGMAMRIITRDLGPALQADQVKIERALARKIRRLESRKVGSGGAGVLIGERPGHMFIDLRTRCRGENFTIIRAQRPDRTKPIGYLPRPCYDAATAHLACPPSRHGTTPTALL